METEVRIVKWHEEGVIIEDPKDFSFARMNFPMPITKVKFMYGLWKIMGMPTRALINEDNELLFKHG